jgi:hypothetical protein
MEYVSDCLQTVTKVKNSPDPLDTEECNEKCQKTHSPISKEYPEILENKHRSPTKELDSRETLPYSRPKPHLGRQNNELDFPAQSCHVEREFIASAEADVKALNASPVSIPTLCKKKPNSVLQSSGDSSDVEDEDDLITSSQGGEDSERKGYVIS